MKPHLSMVLFALVSTACTPSAPEASTPSALSETTNTPATANNPKNATYSIDGDPVTLVNGQATQEAAPGSATQAVTRVFDELTLDLNDDGRADSVLVLEHQPGGSGTHYFVTAALGTASGYLPSNSLYLGDRIAIQTTALDPDNPSQFFVSYADRAEGESFAEQPSLMLSRTFKHDGTALVEVGSP